MKSMTTLTFYRIFYYRLKLELCIAAVFIFISGCAPNGNHIGIQGNDLFYTPAVQAKDAHEAADYLVQTEFFANGNKSVQLDNVDGIPYFRLVVKEGFILDSLTRSTLLTYGRLLQEDLYQKKTFVFHVCDRNFRTLHAFRFNEK